MFIPTLQTDKKFIEARKKLLYEVNHAKYEGKYLQARRWYAYTCKNFLNSYLIAREKI